MVECLIFLIRDSWAGAGAGCCSKVHKGHEAGPSIGRWSHQVAYWQARKTGPIAYRCFEINDGRFQQLNDGTERSGLEWGALSHQLLWPGYCELGDQWPVRPACGPGPQDLGYRFMVYKHLRPSGSHFWPRGPLPLVRQKRWSGPDVFHSRPPSPAVSPQSQKQVKKRWWHSAWRSPKIFWRAYHLLLFQNQWRSLPTAQRRRPGYCELGDQQHGRQAGGPGPQDLGYRFVVYKHLRPGSSHFQPRRPLPLVCQKGDVGQKCFTAGCPLRRYRLRARSKSRRGGGIVQGDLRKYFDGATQYE